MKLLIVTQAVDLNHPILGFFHRWIEEFAKHCEVVHVICLQEGEHSLPGNVFVHSLGKEKGGGRWKYVIKFYSLIWRLRKDYDQVFVHMNQIYVLLGAPSWHIWRKRIALWYMHGSKSLSLELSVLFADRIFTGSKESFPINSNKVVVTGHGIDTTHFWPRAEAKVYDLITVGRITESKNLQILIEILADMRKTNTVTLTIVGEARTETEKVYFYRLQDLIKEKNLENAVIFKGAVLQQNLPSLLSSSKIFVTVAQNGSLDKAVLEAMACGLPVISMAPGAASLPLGSAQTTTVDTFTEELKRQLTSNSMFRADCVSYVQQNHSLQHLIPKLIS